MSSEQTPPPIEPDTKDWTWAIEEPCADCGYDGAHVAAETVSARLRATIPRWVSALGRPDVRTRPEPHIWSPLEYACHVDDVAVLFGQRVTSMLATDHPTFANWDQDQTALERRYWEQVPAEVAISLAAHAEATAALFDSVSGDAWLRRGSRSDGAEFTVASIGVYLMHDIEHHLHDIGA